MAKYLKTSKGIFDITNTAADDKGFYTYVDHGLDGTYRDYIEYKDIIKGSNNLVDLIDEFRYKAYSNLFHIELPHCRCYYYQDGDEYQEGTFIQDMATKRELTEIELSTVKGYIWIGDNLVCIAEIQNHELVLKERK